MDWDRIRIFHAVAQVGSFTRAASRLGLSQSAISRQIGALEEDLGVPVFHRHARGLLLTEQGEILLHTATDVAKRMARVQSVLGAAHDTAAGHLRVNTTVGIGTIWLVVHLREFRERYPDITMSLLVTDMAPGSDDDPATLRATGWLFQDFAMTTLPSVESLGLIRARARRAKGGTYAFLGFGDPALGGQVQATSAASVKLCCSTTATKYSSCRSSMITDSTW